MPELQLLLAAPSYTQLVYLGILALALLLFAREFFSLEITALMILLLLVWTGILTLDQALESFSHDALFLIAALFVLSGGLERTGVISRLERGLLAMSGQNRTFGYIGLMFVSGTLSMFLSNTATVAIMLPVIITFAEKFDESPRYWLMPTAFMAIMGGINTLVGTSTNILISDLLPEYGLEPFNLFTTAVVGIPIFVAGLLYLWLAAPFLLKFGVGPDTMKSIDLRYDLRPYFSEVVVMPESSLAGKTIEQSPLFEQSEVQVVQIVRNGVKIFPPRIAYTLQPGDLLLLQGEIEQIHNLMKKYDLEFREKLKKEEKEGKDSAPRPADLSEETPELHEVLIKYSSRLANQTPAQSNMRHRYGLSVIAIHREHETFHSRIKDTVMKGGDILVVQFQPPASKRILEVVGLIPLQRLEPTPYRPRRASLAIIIFLLSIFLGTVTNLPLAFTCLNGALLMVLVGALSAQEIYEFIEWRILIFIGAILALGKAMSVSGTDTMLVAAMNAAFGVQSPTTMIVIFFFLTVILTQPLSNQAAAVLVLPLAIGSAGMLDVNPMPFVMTVTIAASCSFLTPLEPGSLIVYGPGRYRFMDFFKVGLPLTIICGLIATFLIPVFWPFH